MKDRQTLLAERIARQAHIDSRFVEPVWRAHVDVPLLEMSMAVPGLQLPVILLPEMLFTDPKTLLHSLTDNVFMPEQLVLFIPEQGNIWSLLRLFRNILPNLKESWSSFNDRKHFRYSYNHRC